MINPNPARITAPMWKLWTDRPNSAWKLGGIYADKEKYHNTVLANQARWPGNYSVILPLDLNFGNLDKARAIDLTMSDSEMIKWTRNMKNAAEDPNDPRLDAVREFYGTLDGKTVFGLIKDTVSGVWRRATADLTHLWHGHVGIFARFVNNWNMLSPLLSVWKGESLAKWRSDMLPQYKDSSEEVKYWQRVHNDVRTSVTPSSPVVTVDGDYGDKTVAAFSDFAKKNGAIHDYKATNLSGWLAFVYTKALAKVSAPKPPPPVAIPEDKLREIINTYVASELRKTEINIVGSISGKVVL